MAAMHVIHLANKKSLLQLTGTCMKKVRGAGRAGNSKPPGPALARGGARSSADVLEQAARGALRVSQMRCRRLFEAAREGVLLLDPGTRKITDANPFMRELLGYTLEEFVGKELWEIGLLEDQQTNRQMFLALRKKHFIRCEDLPLQSSRGRTREVEVVANLYQEGPHPVVQCHVRDITERKWILQELLAAKDEISRQAVELREKVAQHTVQLRQTIDELETFSYSVSHDMRSPLAAMRGFAEILLEDHSTQLGSEGIKYLEKIDVAAGRLDTLIQEVLAYTMVLSGDVKIEPVDLDALLRQVIETYPQLQRGQVEIHIEGALPKVMGTEAALVQCMSNLLTNAVKFVAPGTKPRVKVRAQAMAADIRLWVEDNGIGIAPKDQVRIFQMFTRVDHANAYEGTGLGLTIVRKAVERMGGQMGVESEVGQGSKFWIQLKGVKL
jgi:PAS domain S-box-containing protein